MLGVERDAHDGRVVGLLAHVLQEARVGGCGVCRMCAQGGAGCVCRMCVQGVCRCHKMCRHSSHLEPTHRRTAALTSGEAPLRTSRWPWRDFGSPPGYALTRRVWAVTKALSTLF